jgi:hypothetical protein
LRWRATSSIRRAYGAACSGDRAEGRSCGRGGSRQRQEHPQDRQGAARRQSASGRCGGLAGARRPACACQPHRHRPAVSWITVRAPARRLL